MKRPPGMSVVATALRNARHASKSKYAKLFPQQYRGVEPRCPRQCPHVALHPLDVWSACSRVRQQVGREIDSRHADATVRQGDGVPAAAARYVEGAQTRPQRQMALQELRLPKGLLLWNGTPPHFCGEAVEERSNQFGFTRRSQRLGLELRGWGQGRKRLVPISGQTSNT